MNRVTDKERAPYLEAVNALQGKGPMKLDEMHRQVVNEMKELSDAKKNTAKKAEGKAAHK